MSVYDLHFNKDDVTIRNILIGLLATLHETIFWHNQIHTDVADKKLIKVPFYFSTTGTERYLQDNFLNNIDFDPENLKAEAFYNKIPRGIVDLTGISIEAQNIVNKYVRMNHQVQEEDGTLNTYNTETFWVPIILSLDATIYTDSILDQLKATEAIITAFFKSKAYQIDVAYTRIPCLIIFPDDYTNDRTIEFSFTDKREFVTKFSIQVKSHIPIFKPETTIFAGTTMEAFQSNINIPPLNFGPDGGGANPNAPNIADPGVGNGANNTTPNNPSGQGQGPIAPITPNPNVPNSIPQTQSPLNQNNGDPGATGVIGSSGSVGPDLPTWPNNPNSTYPPSGPTSNT